MVESLGAGLLAIVGLVLAIIAFSTARRLRADVDSARREIDELRQRIGDVDDLRRRLQELTEAASTAPAPPLPRRRSAGLDDLRQQLRQAHNEADDDPASA